MGVYDITERDHIEIAAPPHGFRVAGRLARRARPFLQRQPRFLEPDRAPRPGRFRAVRIGLPRRRNAQRPHAPEAPTPTPRRWPISRRRAEVGGSDAHVMASVGCAWTVVPGRAQQGGVSGRPAPRPRQGARRDRRPSKLTRDVLAIGGLMVRENPCACRSRPWRPRFPLVILGNYVVETAFARFWMARYLRAQGHARRRVVHGAPVAEVAV